jgi:ParB/RepB/Spo0J family partition protein
MIEYSKRNIDISLDKITTTFIKNPRQSYDEDYISSLMQSIASIGQQQSVGVYPITQNKFGLIWGFCRFKAVEELTKQGVGDNTIRCDILDNKQEMGDILLLNLQENVVRKQLTPLEEARAIESLQDHKTQEEICDALGWSKSLFTQRSKILSYSEILQQAIQDGLPIRAASLISELPEELHEKYIDIAMTTSIVKLRELIDAYLNSNQDEREPVDVSNISLADEEDEEDEEEKDNDYIETPTHSRAGELRDLLLSLLSQVTNSDDQIMAVQSIDFTRLLSVDQDRLLSVLQFLASDEDDELDYEEIDDDDDDDYYSEDDE